MAAIWELQNRYQKWLDIEILAAEAQAKLGNIPADAVAEIKEKAAFDVNRALEIEKEVRHDVIALLTSVKEHVGEAARYVHFGLTSSDVVDTGLSVQMREAAEIIIKDVKELLTVLKKKAFEYKDLPVMGRTHTVHADIMPFGQKLAIWFFEMQRNLKRLEEAREIISYGKLSGATGSYTNIDPLIEKYVCDKLGLKVAEASSQILQRDRHAEFMNALAITACSLEKFATEIRHLQRTEVAEAAEPFKEKQKGSSAMPHKRNPIISERICGLARIIRTNALAAMEDVALWHERDISHSSVERVIIPDSTILLDYILSKFTKIIEGLVVYPENMKTNIDKSKGVFFSQRVLLALIDKGITREDAYRIVQSSAMTAMDGDLTFKQALEENPKASVLSKEELEKIFDISYYLERSKIIFERLEKTN